MEGLEEPLSSEVVELVCNSENSEPNPNLPQINTDDLPITPVKNKRWLNNATPPPDFTNINLTYSVSPLNNIPYPEVNVSASINLPNTDNLLDISAPKITLLGKEQAKKRLHAFSVTKQSGLNASSPLPKQKCVKQPKFLIQSSDIKYNENGEKTEEKLLIKKPSRKTINPNQKAKAVIEEIEEIKKIESAYLEAVEQGWFDKSKRRRSNSREKSSKRHSRKQYRRNQSAENVETKKFLEKPRYPRNWAEVKEKNYDFETLSNMKPKELKNNDKECVDYRKQLLFQSPSLPLNRLTIKASNGNETNIPVDYVRFTRKIPRISYSVHLKMPHDCYLRQTVFQYVPKSFRELMKKITDNCTNTDVNQSIKNGTIRKWFPKNILVSLESSPECKILETSLGLSFLQTYSDEDEQEKEMVEEKSAREKSDRKEVTETTDKKKFKHKKDKKVKSKKNKSNKKRNETNDVDMKKNKKKKHSMKVKKSKRAKILNEEKVLPKMDLEKVTEKLSENLKKLETEKPSECLKKLEEKPLARPKKVEDKTLESSKELEEKLVESSKFKEKLSERLKIFQENPPKSSNKFEEKLSESPKVLEEKLVEQSKKFKDKLSERLKKFQEKPSKSPNKFEEKPSETPKKLKEQLVTNSKFKDKLSERLKGFQEKSSSSPITFEEKPSESLKKFEKNPPESSKKFDEKPSKSSRKSKEHVSESSKRLEGRPDKNKEENKTNASKEKSRELKFERRMKSKTKSKSPEHKTKSKLNKEHDTGKVKCVAEKEFGTPDTDEYYSNWESDLELEKQPSQTTVTNCSWQSYDDNSPLSESRRRQSLSPLPLPQPKIKPTEQQTATELRDKRRYSSDRSRRSPLRESRSRSRHLDELPQPRETFSPTPMEDDFSPFRNRCVDDRRRSRRSLERLHSPIENFLEMPLNIRNTRNYWDNSRSDGNVNKYGRSPERTRNSEEKMYSLYTENQWERDDYLTIKTEELRLEEERRTLIEERRKLEIERRQFEELERQRYYSRMMEFDEDRCDDRRQEVFNSDNDSNSYRVRRDYRSLKEHQTYSKEGDLRRSPEDQRSRRRFSLEKPQDERPRSNFNWEENVENKSYGDEFKRRQKTKSFDEPENNSSSSNNNGNKYSSSQISKVEHKTYGKEKEKERKVTRKGRWDSSEEEGDKKIIKDEAKKCKDVKVKDRKANVNKEKESSQGSKSPKSLTDNLVIPPRKSQSSKALVHKQPELLENEYEKFIQALGSEISAAEDISDKDLTEKKHKLSKTKSHDKRRKRRSHSASSDDEFKKKEVKKRKAKEKLSSSSSSWSSSTSSGSDSSTSDSSSDSSSSESSDEKHNTKVKKRKLDAAKNKTETLVKQKNKSKICAEIKQGVPTDKQQIKAEIKIEDANQLPSKTSVPNMGILETNTKTSSPLKGINLNIIDLSIPEFSLNKIPLPNYDVLQTIPKSTVPLPVPSPKLPLSTTTTNNMLELPIVTPKIEPVAPILPATTILPVELQQVINAEPEERNETTKILTSPIKRNNLIPIKFLTPEKRKEANDTPNIQPFTPIETKCNKTNLPSTETHKSNLNYEKIEDIESTLPLANSKRHFAISSMNPQFEGSDRDENSTDFTDKLMRRDDGFQEVSTTADKCREYDESVHKENIVQTTPERRRRDSRERYNRGSITPRRNRNFSPHRRSRSPYRSSRSRGKDVSPRRWDRDRSPLRFSWDRPRRDSYRRNSMSPRHNRRDRRSISPQRHFGLRKRLSPSKSPKSRYSREISPKRYRIQDRSLSKERHGSIQEALLKIAGVDKYSNLLKPSPVSSPLHGFKKSVADSTISDEQLLQKNLEEFSDAEKPKSSVPNAFSPKRMSLDERINQALGLSDQQPKPISTTYSDNVVCDPQYLDEYGQYYEHFSEKMPTYNQTYTETRHRENSNLKVVRVGNVLQVVPTEDVNPPKPPPVQQNKVTNSTQKIVQVGNMLQIVPTTVLPEMLATTPPTPTTVTPTPATAITSKDTLNLEALVKLKAERRAEKDNRRQERDRRRKEKEKKRKEREKRRQLKAKLQTEALIKQALIQDTEQTENDENVSQVKTEPLASVQWPPAPQIVVNSLYKPAGKGILREPNDDEDEIKSQLHIRHVTFSDGIMPGEGTSPSGGEELSSPPPPKTLPKEKRYIKTKIPKKQKILKKKKVKVKVIRQQLLQDPDEDDEEAEEDLLPPPPPPPGSPPPHIFPTRIKCVINNIHPNINITSQTLQNTNTSYPPPSIYPPPQPNVNVLMQHHGPPHLDIHNPPPPPHHVPFNPSHAPPVISTLPPFRPPNVQPHGVMGMHQHHLQSPHFPHHQ